MITSGRLAGRLYVLIPSEHGDLTMTYSQYLRLRLHVADTNRELVKRAHRMLSKRGKTAECRAARHEWLRELIAYHSRAFVEYRQVMGGRS